MSDKCSHAYRAPGTGSVTVRLLWGDVGLPFPAFGENLTSSTKQKKNPHRASCTDTTITMRQLKYHEKKLLKKVDLLNWKSDDDHREVKVMRRYHLQNRDDYSKYNKLCGQIRQLAYKISLLSADDPMRTEKEGQLLGKLYDSGLLSVGTKLSEVESKVTVSAMCRRRLAIICVKLKLCETVSTVGFDLLPLYRSSQYLRQAVKYIEQGHIRVGPDRITDPAYLVTRFVSAQASTRNLN